MTGKPIDMQVALARAYADRINESVEQGDFDAVYEQLVNVGAWIASVWCPDGGEGLVSGHITIQHDELGECTEIGGAIYEDLVASLGRAAKRLTGVLLAACHLLSQGHHSAAVAAVQELEGQVYPIEVLYEAVSKLKSIGCGLTSEQP